MFGCCGHRTILHPAVQAHPRTGSAAVGYRDDRRPMVQSCRPVGLAVTVARSEVQRDHHYDAPSGTVAAVAAADGKDVVGEDLLSDAVPSSVAEAAVVAVEVAVGNRSNCRSCCRSHQAAVAVAGTVDQR